MITITIKFLIIILILRKGKSYSDNIKEETIFFQPFRIHLTLKSLSFKVAGDITAAHTYNKQNVMSVRVDENIVIFIVI